MAKYTIIITKGDLPGYLQEALLGELEQGHVEEVQLNLPIDRLERYAYDEIEYRPQIELIEA